MIDDLISTHGANIASCSGTLPTSCFRTKSDQMQDSVPDLSAQRQIHDVSPQAVRWPYRFQNARCSLLRVNEDLGIDLNALSSPASHYRLTYKQRNLLTTSY